MFNITSELAAQSVHGTSQLALLLVPLLALTLASGSNSQANPRINHGLRYSCRSRIHPENVERAECHAVARCGHHAVSGQGGGLGIGRRRQRQDLEVEATEVAVGFDDAERTGDMRIRAELNAGAVEAKARKRNRRADVGVLRELQSRLARIPFEEDDTPGLRRLVQQF